MTAPSHSSAARRLPSGKVTKPGSMQSLFLASETCVDPIETLQIGSKWTAHPHASKIAKLRSSLSTLTTRYLFIKNVSVKTDNSGPPDEFSDRLPATSDCRLCACRSSIGYCSILLYF